MTKVLARHTGDYYLVEATGHADGVDTCNFITGILYAFAGYAYNAAQKGQASIAAYTTDKDAGAFHLQLTSGGEGVKAAFDMTIIGLLQLEQERPEAVRVDLRGEF